MILLFEVIRTYNNVQRPDGRGEPARTRRQSLEERGERDGRGWGEKERPNEAKRGDKRRYASEVSRRARGDAAGRGEGWVKESRPSQVYACSLFDRTDSYANTVD